MTPRAPRRYRISIGGRKWLLEVGVQIPDDRWGDCSHPNSKKRRIRIHRAARGEVFLDVLLHELIHARWWALCETEVTEFANELTAILRKFKEEVIEALED